MPEERILLKARGSAAAMLGRKMLTCHELFDRLCKKGFDKETAEKVVSEFVEAGYLNDLRYAEMYIADSASLGAKGMFRIRRELMQKGISASVIEAAADEAEPDTESALRDYIEQRSLCSRVHSRRELENLKARLVRRGYSLYEINGVLSDYEFCFDDDSRW